MFTLLFTPQDQIDFFIRFLFFSICVLLRTISTVGTYYGVFVTEKTYEGNPVMRYFFNKYGFKQTTVITSLIVLLAILFFSFIQTKIIWQIIFIVILAMDTINNISVVFSITKKS